MRFVPYEKIAESHTEEQKRIADLKDLFDGATELYQEKHFTRALEEFRKVAIRDPEYPQLGYYLVQAEAASEKERSQRLGEEKRLEIERAFQNGLAALEKEQLPDAEADFEKVLHLDPSHPQARAYLVMTQAEEERRNAMILKPRSFHLRSGAHRLRQRKIGRGHARMAHRHALEPAT